MDNFSERAKQWDANPMHLERSTAIAKALMAAIPETASMRLLDFGAGTGILGGLLAPGFREVVMMDNAIGMVEVMQEKVGGYLVIADLYPEDGSFHGEGFNGHLGFEKTWLEQTLDIAGFAPVSMDPCFIIRRIQEEKALEFPVFLSVSQKK